MIDYMLKQDGKYWPILPPDELQKQILGFMLWPNGLTWGQIAIPHHIFGAIGRQHYGNVL